MSTLQNDCISLLILAQTCITRWAAPAKEFKESESTICVQQRIHWSRNRARLTDVVSEQTSDTSQRTLRFCCPCLEKAICCMINNSMCK